MRTSRDQPEMQGLRSEERIDVLWVNGCRGGRLGSSRSDDNHPQNFQSCTLRPLDATLFARSNSYLSRRRHSLIEADDGNCAQSSLRASPGCGVLQNGSRCARRRTNLSSTLISSPVPAAPSHFSSRSATQTPCRGQAVRNIHICQNHGLICVVFASSHA